MTLKVRHKEPSGMNEEIDKVILKNATAQKVEY